MKSNTFAALTNLDAAESYSIPHFLCPSSNCTWDPVDILSANYECMDVSSNLEYYCNKSDVVVSWGGIDTDCKVSLPAGPVSALGVGHLQKTMATCSCRIETRIGHELSNPQHVRYSRYSHMGTVFALTTTGVSFGKNQTRIPLIKSRYIRARNVDVTRGFWGVNLTESTHVSGAGIGHTPGHDHDCIVSASDRGSLHANISKVGC